MPLRCWDELVAKGELTEADWTHSGVPVGWDGGYVSLITTLQQARHYREDERHIPNDRPILRIRVPHEYLHEVRATPGGEEVPCYPREIPADWIEVVDESEPDEPPPHVLIPWLRNGP
jgi:hypothetical protein